MSLNEPHLGNVTEKRLFVGIPELMAQLLDR